MTTDNLRRVIVALDNLEEARAIELAQELQDGVWGFKVNDLLLHCGVSIIARLREYGQVFADAKVHEIPNTTSNSVRRLADAGASLITVHASGGEAMLAAAAKAAGDASVCAVTVLTSLSDEHCAAVYGHSAEVMVERFAMMAARSGVAGIICSPQELPMLSKQEQTAALMKVCPGVRPQWHMSADDQNRTATPVEALKGGADLLVIGRPITAAAVPRQALDKINDELG